ncbi:MAG: hypothetical protein AAFR96_02155 [Planctomycetota bacterium]
MKAIYNAVAILAILHLVLVGGLVAWVVASGRIDDRRVADLRGILTETVAQRDARETEEAAEAEAEAQAAALALEDIPLTAEQQIERKLTLSEADRQVVQRMRREVEDLRRALRAERGVLDEQRAAFIAERDAFESQRDRIEQTEGDEQFQAVLATLKTMKAGLAYELLDTTIQQEPGGLETVTAYLDNLPPRNRGKIIDEFNKNDPALAAGLLERLRTRGLVAAADGP